MKKTILLLTMALIVFACKKKDVSPSSPTPAPIQEPQIKTVAHFTVENNSGFIQTNGYFDYVAGVNNGGNVSINGITMTCPYSYYAGSNTITISNPVIWVMNGGVISGTTSVPNQTVTAKNMPAMPISADIDTSKTVDANLDYVINNQSVSCDSMIYSISSTTTKRVAGGTTSVTFKSSELKNVSYGIIVGGSKSVIVSISAYNSYTVKVGDYNWRFISKTTNAKYLHFKN